MLISDNSPVRIDYLILTLYRMKMQGYCNILKWTLLRRTPSEVRCLHPTSSRQEICMPSVSNVIYHKFSHGAASYMVNGKKSNVKFECTKDSKYGSSSVFRVAMVHILTLYWAVCSCFDFDNSAILPFCSFTSCKINQRSTIIQSQLL